MKFITLVSLLSFSLIVSPLYAAETTTTATKTVAKPVSTLLQNKENSALKIAPSTTTNTTTELKASSLPAIGDSLGSLGEITVEKPTTSLPEEIQADGDKRCPTEYHCRTQHGGFIFGCRLDTAGGPGAWDGPQEIINFNEHDCNQVANFCRTLQAPENAGIRDANMRWWDYYCD